MKQSILILLLLSLFTSCKKEIHPIKKSSPKFYMGLEISKYESHDGTNYLEDLMQVFPDTAHLNPNESL
jgi:hypothetical protein